MNTWLLTNNYSCLPYLHKVRMIKQSERSSNLSYWMINLSDQNINLHFSHVPETLDQWLRQSVNRPQPELLGICIDKYSMRKLVLVRLFLKLLCTPHVCSLKYLKTNCDTYQGPSLLRVFCSQERYTVNLWQSCAWQLEYACPSDKVALVKWVYYADALPDVTYVISEL